MNAPAPILLDADVDRAIPLGRGAASDYSEKKAFHVHNGSRAGWRLAPRSST